MSDTVLMVADVAVGSVLVACAATTWFHRSDSRVGVVMAGAALCWFLGNLVPALAFVHRGPLVHLHISYPTGRLRRPIAALTVAVAYAAAVFDGIARDPWFTAGLAILIAVAAADVFARASGRARKAGGPALGAALAFAAVLAVSSANALLELNADRAVLLTYDAVVCLVIIGLTLDLLYGRWTDATVADLVTQLGGQQETSGLQGDLRQALGDPDLTLGYWVPEQAGYVDESGRSVDPQGDNRIATFVVDGVVPVAVLLHDRALLSDSALLTGASAALRLAVTNARMRAEVQTRLREVATSRRRIVEVADDQRRALQAELSAGAERHLADVDRLLAELDAAADDDTRAESSLLLPEVTAARGELQQFANGIRPPLLASGGLSAAVPPLARLVGVPVSVRIEVDRLSPALESVLYFVCSEALTNIAKHASATHASIAMWEQAGHVVAEVGDDGSGRADPLGSGLRGIADRVEALGGRFEVSGRPGGGTLVAARIPAGRGARS